MIDAIVNEDYQPMLKRSTRFSYNYQRFFIANRLELVCNVIEPHGL